MRRIGLDLRPTEPGFKAHFGRGTGRYTSELVKHMVALQDSGGDKRLELCPVGSAELGATGLERAFYQLLPLGRVTVEQQLLLPRRIKRLGADLFHFFAHVDAPASCTTPYVVTILDLIPLKFPELYKADKPNWRYSFARYLEHKAIERACGFIAISRATKRDIVEMLGIHPDRIVVTPLAVSNAFNAGEGIQRGNDAYMLELREKFGLPGDRPMLLYVGGIDARKNVIFLLDVFADVVRAHVKGPSPILVMVGRYQADKNYERLQKRILELKLERDVVLQGFVDDNDLPDIYRASDVTLFPSLYEGFGLPVLESMACGVPVIAARNSSIPEVCGEHGVLLSDNDKDAWVRSIVELLGASDRRRELGLQGVNRARKFTWEQTARLKLEAYSYFLGFDEESGRKNRSQSANISF